MNTKVQSRPPSAAREVSMRPVTLRVGVFFDGTGNNRRNSLIAQTCRNLMQAGQREHTQACGGRHVRQLSSYANDLSNIARLFELYREQNTAIEEGGRWAVYWPLYIGGVGTTSAGRDSFWPGKSLGRGTTGVLAKVDSAIKKLAARLAAFAQDNPGCVIEALELDIFGFSRGAASARHLVNEVLKQERGALGPLLDNPQLAFASDFAWQQGSVRVMLVGLFDTVAAVGSWRDLGSVRDASNRRVNLYLPPGCARQVLHLVARDEWRRNFALNSVQPGWQREIMLPGAHSDIGGGYHALMQEEVLLTRPHTSVIDAATRHEDSPAWQQAQADLQSLEPGQWSDPDDPGAGLRVQSSIVAGGRSGNASGSRLIMASVVLRREVRGELSRVHLRIMHALACDEGAPFAPLENTLHLALPEELDEIAQRLVALARGENVELTEQQEQLLRRRYIHHSAHWSPIIGTLGGLTDALFVHAPQAGGRIRHPNAPQPGYPH